MITRETLDFLMMLGQRIDTYLAPYYKEVLGVFQGIADSLHNISQDVSDIADLLNEIKDNMPQN